MKKCFAAAIALAALATPASAQVAVGGWVLAQWKGDQYWFPGVVTAVKDGRVTIKYDDGTTEIRPINQVKSYDWHVNSKVQCRWTDGKWYGAKITSANADGLHISVLYDDGDRQDTTTGKCRSL